MPKAKQHHSNRKYIAKTVERSPFDKCPTLVVNEFIVPVPYRDAVWNVIATYRQGIPFNRAVDQVALLYQDTINRNKLAEYALRTIANDN